MTNKIVPFVRSAYERIIDDNYQTIDSRCVDGLLEHITITSNAICYDVCSPNSSGIVNDLKRNGYNAVGLPDAFAENIMAQWIITNPPYTRGIVDKIVNRQIDRIITGEVGALAILVRSGFDFAKGRRAMFDSPYYCGQIKLRFRPWWSEERIAQPIHNYVWQIWAHDNSANHSGPARVMYAG